MSVASAVEALRASLAGGYPTRIAERTNRPGAVTCIVMPRGGEAEPLCDPPVQELEADVELLAAGSSGQAVTDLLAHVEAVQALIAAAGWMSRTWDTDTADGVPMIRFTATAPA